jgi:hypothetical protein
MAHELSDIEEKAFKIFGVVLIVIGLIAFFIAVTGSEVINEGRVSLEEGMSKTIGMRFEEGQVVFVSFDVESGPKDINLIIETHGVLSGNFVDVEKTGTNKVSFEANETQEYYMTFVNSGGENIVFDYEIAIDGYNQSSGYYYVSFMTIILGALILFAFYKDAFI